ncbi:hypothetical protein Hanom_Chr00s000940g01670671 [Helianthus anomalus]
MKTSLLSNPAITTTQFVVTTTTEIHKFKKKNNNNRGDSFTAKAICSGCSCKRHLGL